MRSRVFAGQNGGKRTTRVGDVAEISASDLARAIVFADEVIDSVVNDETFQMQMGPDINPQMTLLLMAQAIKLLFAEANAGAPRGR